MLFYKNILNLYKKLLAKRKKVVKTVASVQASTSKHAMNGCCTLEFSAKTEQIKNKIDEHLKELIKTKLNSSEKVIQYMRLKGVNVYKIRNAEKWLAKIGEEEGFLTPLKGIKAILLNLVIGALYENKLKISFSTKEMVIFDTKTTDFYLVIRALYKYYGFMKKLPGYDYNSQETFKRVYGNKQTNAIMNCSLKEVIACKEAVSRDMESIKFVVELSNEYSSAKKVLQQIKDTNSANL